MSEEVLIIPNNLLQAHIQEGAGCLITEKKEQVFDKILNNQMFMVRNDAEYNFDHKQIIPYVVIRNDNKYLLLQRLSKQTEKRLHNKYSLGIGGHINPESSIQEDNIILNGLYRELNEEVAVGDVSGLHFVGIINDERNDVSRVHLGLLYVLDVQSSEYRVLETEKMTAKWVSQQELKKHYDALETWSQIVYDQYIKK
jgi:predicted NUDIX family phosphoesterase